VLFVNRFLLALPDWLWCGFFAAIAQGLFGFVSGHFLVANGFAVLFSVGASVEQSVT